MCYLNVSLPALPFLKVTSCTLYFCYFSIAHLISGYATESPLCFSAEATWTKDNTNIAGVANYTVKVEGERHSLLIKSAKISDGGKYCVTAVNQVGKASSSATLTVKGGKTDF